MIADRNPQVIQLQTLQRFEHKILESCNTCDSQKGQTSFRDLLNMRTKGDDNISIHDRVQTQDEENTRYSPFSDERLNTGPDRTSKIALSPIKFDSKRTEEDKSVSNEKYI
jgi:hypothetical protein